MKDSLLLDAVYRVLWDVFKSGYITKEEDYAKDVEFNNVKLREMSDRLIEFIKENSEECPKKN